MYDDKGNKVTHLSDQDVRAEAATMVFAKDAPLHLLFVADYAKLGMIPQPKKEGTVLCSSYGCYRPECISV
jgi:hypothetical protein